MPWTLAAVLSIIATVCALLVQRLYSQRTRLPSSFPPALAFILGVAPLSIIVGLSIPHEVHWTWEVIGLLAINATLIAVANWLNFMAIKRLPIAQFQMISQVYIIATVALSWTFLREGLTSIQIVGALLLLSATILAVKAPIKNRTKEHKKIHFGAILLVLGGAIALGTALFVEKKTLGYMDTGAYLIFGYTAQVIGMVILAAKDAKRSNLKKINFREIKWAAGMGLIAGTAGILYVISIVGSNNVSFITAISAITLPLLAFAGYIFLKEKENVKILAIGLGLGFVGVLLMALGG